MSTDISTFASTVSIYGGAENFERMVIKANSTRYQQILVNIDGSTRLVTGAGVHGRVLDTVILKPGWRRITMEFMYYLPSGMEFSEEVTSFGPQLVRGNHYIAAVWAKNLRDDPFIAVSVNLTTDKSEPI